MRRLTLLAVLALGLSACGGSGAKNTLKITVGRNGGLVPYSVTIAPDGSVTTKGMPPAKPAALTSAQDEEVSKLVRDGFGQLHTSMCPGTFGDEAMYYITALGKTVTVRGTCEPAFTKLWSKLTTALGLNQ